MEIILTRHLFLKNPPEALVDTLVERLQMTNPKWLENDRMGRWNAKTPKVLKFYKKTADGGLIIPRGYARNLILTCRAQKISHELVDRRRTLSSVDLEFRGTLRPFQKRAVDTMLSKDFGTLSLPTGSGKTVVGLYMIARRKQPAMVVVHTRDLADQWVERIGEFLGIGRDEVGLIAGGKVKMGDRITVAMVQSLYKCASRVSERIGYLVVDECHRTPSRTFTEAVRAFDSRYMLGLSATPWRRDRLSKLIFWHLGDLHFQLDRAELTKSGDVVPAEVIFRQTEFKPFHDPTTEYSRMLAELVGDDERNRMIAADIAEASRKRPGVCLVLSDRKAHCETLRAMLKYGHGVDSELLTGDISPGDRQDVLNRLNAGKIKVLIATGQLVGEGFDCRELSTLFLGTPIRFSGRLIQYLGRVLRPSPGKKAALVYDYEDIHVDALQAAARQRRRVYDGEAEGE